MRRQYMLLSTLIDKISAQNSYMSGKWLKISFMGADVRPERPALPFLEPSLTLAITGHLSRRSSCGRRYGVERDQACAGHSGWTVSSRRS